MQPLEASELKAFLLALYQLDAPLPDAVQAQVNNINIPADIDKLYDIAISYPPLATYYEQVHEFLNANSQIRSRGPLPAKINHAAEQQSTEINNILVAVEIEDEKLTEISQPILKAADSVSKAKEIWTNIKRFLHS
ncbi:MULTISPECIES: hypothetical protein [Nostocales]|nr:MULTISPECIES: hypothetical protein [Nostocales]